MNYLAHAYLSFHEPEILVGNLIADFVKGNQKKLYPEKIFTGLLYHQKIDQFTDEHVYFIESKQLFHPHFYLSAGIFTDIIFDHFLARHTQYFTPDSLFEFSTYVYDILSNHQQFFTPEMHYFFNAMRKHNWLYHYHTIEGLTKTIQGMCKRFPKLGNAEFALQVIEQRYHDFEKQFELFFPALETYCLSVWPSIIDSTKSF